MMNGSVAGVLVIVACFCSLVCVSVVLCTTFEYFTDQWAVEIEGGNESLAKELARRHGFSYVTTVRQHISRSVERRRSCGAWPKRPATV